MLSVAVSDRNIFGSGLNVGLNLEKSTRTKNYAFNISNPRLNDSDFSGNFSVNSSSTDYTDSSGYKIDSQGINVGTGHRFNRYVSGYLGYGYSSNQYDTNTTYDPRYDSYSKSYASISASFDNTDDYYVPREGMAFSQSIEKAGIGGDADFIKSRTSFGIYQGLQKLTDFDLILRYKARFNYAKDTGKLPIGEKFYMGGIGSVRGYQSYSLSPRGTTYLSGGTLPDLIGGAQTFSNSLEFSVPLVPEAKMRATAFVDYGMIGDKSISEIQRGGYGISLEWFSPVGPLQLVFSNPLKSEAGDDIAHFEFTIGQRF
jgi:outer membrane protein insertion porin family